MNPEIFYQKTAERHYDSPTLPEPSTFVGTWGRKARIQIAYEMLAPFAPFAKLLDIGCGDLTNLINLEKLFDQGYGIDIAAYPCWEIARDRFQICQQNLDNGTLPYPEHCFDAVTLLMVLEHVFDPFTVIEQISRVVKPQGYLVINVPNIAYIKHRLGLLVGRLPVTSNLDCWQQREWDGGHIHYFTLERLTWLLEKFGKFRVIDIQSSGKLGPIKRLLPGLLCSDLQLLCQRQIS